MLRPTIEDAIAFAAQKHKGQVDEAGVPYIYHPLNVMRRLHTEEERIVAVLHDVCEDCGVTFEELRQLGYSELVIEAIDYLTKRPGEQGDNYPAFIERIRRGPALAIKVKLADLADNMDPDRGRENNEYNCKRLLKYQFATTILQQALEAKQ